MLKIALLKEKIKVNMIDTLTCQRSEAMTFGLKQINSSDSIPFSFDLELIGMSYYEEVCIILIDDYS